MADFKHSSNTPESRTDSSVVLPPEENFSPTTGFDDSPMVGLPPKGPGQGIPANRKTIH